LENGHWSFVIGHWGELWRTVIGHLSLGRAWKRLSLVIIHW
jgi:hypothetical protein